MDAYNHTNKLFLNKEIDLTALKAILTNGYVFAATETAMTNVNAAEVSGNGWTAGGENVTSVAVTIVNTNEAQLDAADLSVTATGGDIGPADGLVVYDSLSNLPIFHYSFASAQTAGDGTPFNITWNAAGLYTVAPAP